MGLLTGGGLPAGMGTHGVFEIIYSIRLCTSMHVLEVVRSQGKSPETPPH